MKRYIYIEEGSSLISTAITLPPQKRTIFCDGVPYFIQFPYIYFTFEWMVNKEENNFLYRS